MARSGQGSAANSSAKEATRICSISTSREGRNHISFLFLWHRLVFVLIRFLHFHLSQIRPLQDSSLQVASDEIRISQIGPGQIGSFPFFAVFSRFIG